MFFRVGAVIQPSFLLALRAFAALSIVFHHFALYVPSSDWAAPLKGGVLDWLAEYARTTQVFFVVGGYVAAHTLGSRDWTLGHLGRFALQRYCRLGLPCLAVVFAMPAIIGFARGWVDDELLGQPATAKQLVAHVFLLQDILGYEALSAGLWFVGISFQLGVAYALGLVLQQGCGRYGQAAFALLAWGGAAYALFHFNLDAAGDAWALYFWPYFYLGVLVQKAPRLDDKAEFWAFQGLLLLAALFAWRWRLLMAIAVGLLLYVAQRTGWGRLWPRGGVLTGIGRISYSLFLVHFPVLLLVSAVWARFAPDWPAAAATGLAVAFTGSLAVAWGFHRWVESPAARLSRRFGAVGT